MQHTTAYIAARLGAPRRRALGGLHPLLLRRVALVLAALGAVALLAWGLSKLAGGGPAAPKRQVARIAVLPDAPPPPPPPPPKELKPEPPKNEARAQPTPDNTPKPPQPADAPIKMEGAAGNGPSAFAAGSVSQDYKGGVPQVGSAASAGAGAADRAAERLYANTVRQMLRDEIERHLAPEAGELQASFALWIQPDGRIGRWELDGPAGQTELKLALDRSAEQLRLPAPPGPSQALRFRLTVRAGG